MGLKPNWCAIDRTHVSNEEFWNQIQPRQYSTEDLFYLKDRTRNILGNDPHYIQYWIWSILLFFLSYFGYCLSQVPTKDAVADNTTIWFTLILFIVGIALIPYSFYIKKKQLKQAELLNKCRISITEEIDRRDVLAYLNKYQKHEDKIS